MRHTPRFNEALDRNPVDVVEAYRALVNDQAKCLRKVDKLLEELRECFVTGKVDHDEWIAKLDAYRA